MINEVYKLTLSHYITDTENPKDRYLLEEPLVVEMVLNGNFPSPICLNEMLNKMKAEVLKRADI